jgi:hypothetical protein
MTPEGDTSVAPTPAACAARDAVCGNTCRKKRHVHKQARFGVCGGAFSELFGGGGNSTVKICRKSCGEISVSSLSSSQFRALLYWNKSHNLVIAGSAAAGE